MCRGLYAVLGVSRTASKDTVKKAYLRLAKQLHPDVNPEAGARQKFQEVRQAYEVLADDAKRKEHDKSLGFNSAGAGFAHASRSQSSQSSSSTSSSSSSSWAAGSGHGHWYSAAGQGRQTPGASYQYQQWAKSTQAGSSADAQAWQERQRRHYEEQFRQQMYYRELTNTMLRVAFLVTGPFFLVSVLVARYMSTTNRGGHGGRDFSSSQVVLDSQGRAHIVDAYGRYHRLPDLDRASSGYATS
mmetsp:Transcript_70501/g.168868  ORF Transcript_70501/g.168868 Transcript_70501/m.168868 type:complete len:243 (-) Transcript_70501:64-792(-)